MISLEKIKLLTPLHKLPKNVGDLGKLIVLKSCPKSNKLSNLVTLVANVKISCKFTLQPCIPQSLVNKVYFGLYY